MIETCNGIVVDSPDGRKFLKGIADGAIPCIMRTSEELDWRIAFVGLKDGDTVVTNSFIGMKEDGSDGRPKAKAIESLDAETMLIASMLLDGWRFHIGWECDDDLASHGISLLGLFANRDIANRDKDMAAVDVGWKTVLVHGKQKYKGTVWLHGDDE